MQACPSTTIAGGVSLETSMAELRRASTSSNNGYAANDASPPALMRSIAYEHGDILLHQLNRLCRQQHAANTVVTAAATMAGSSSLAQPNQVAVSAASTSAALPFTFPPDSSSSSLKSTNLAGQLISCFVIGGECRLCFPQIYSLILKDVDHETIVTLFKELHIQTRQATQEQIESLKLAKALPMTASSCGLVTKSDAERLVALLKQREVMSLSDDQRQQLNNVQVEHDCFGGCTGRLYTQLLPHPCFECSNCLQLFTPEDFVRHSHVNSEIERVCHWGFDAANWKHYIRLPDNLVDDMRSQEMLLNFLHGENIRKRAHSLDTESEIALKRQALISMALQQQALAQANALNPTPPVSLPSFGALQTTLALQALQKLGAGTNGLNALVAAAAAISSGQLPPQPQPTSVLNSPMKKYSVDESKLSAMAASAIAAASGKVNGFVDPNPLKSGLWNDLGSSKNHINSLSVQPKEPIGIYPAEKALHNLLGQYMPQEDLARVKDLMNEAVTDRLRPYLDENEALRLETKRLREELARVSGLNGLVKPDNLNTSTATTSAFTSPIRV
jgi:hypothetical protein